MNGKRKPEPGANKATRVTHLGRAPESQAGFVNPPLYRGSTVLSRTAADLRKVGQPDSTQPYTYGRRGTPTTAALADALCELDGGALTLLTPSGLSAISATLLSLTEPGAHVLMTDSVYWPARDFCARDLTRLGVDTDFYDPRIGDGIADLIRPETRVIYTETPGSLMLEMQDLPAIAEVAQAHDIWLVTDNTWATPLGLQPLALGADIAIQSATKYITGHADAMLGVITSNTRAAAPVKATYEAMGLCAGSEETYSGLRGLRTLELRLARHTDSALQVSEWLQSRPEVSRVFFPPLPDTPEHGLWVRDFDGGCGVLSFVMPDAAEAKVEAFLDTLSLFGLGWSWGGFESLAVPFHPQRSRTVTADVPAGAGIRLSIGLEDLGDLLDDLERGFAAMKV